MVKHSLSERRAGIPVRLLAGLAWLLGPGLSHASMFKGEALDKAADVLTIVVLVLVPLIAITVFWLVHVLPEKIAHKRHHPQRDAIQTLCLLSLVFGGMLWPLAWLWAFTKPVGYRMAYGTDLHEDFFEEAEKKYRAGALSAAEIRHLRDELDAMDDSGALPAKLRGLRNELDRGAPAPMASGATAAAPAPAKES